VPRVTHITHSRKAVDNTNENGYRLYMPQRATAKQTQENHAVGVAAPTQLPRISSQSLLGPRGELIIEHDGREYRLRLTQNGKLILTA
jgi:hemin uptake protein HemP